MSGEKNSIAENNNIAYTSDWHIHTEASYDASLTVDEILKRSAEGGIVECGISDHVNYPFMYRDFERSRQLFDKHRRDGFHFGVELTTIPQNEYEFALKHPEIDSLHEFGRMLQYERPRYSGAVPIALPLGEEELASQKVEYVIAAPHWPFSVPDEREALIEEYRRQNLFVATDRRVDIVAHPWWFYSKKWADSNGHMTGGPWFDDFSVIPRSVHEEFAAAIKETGKFVELNTYFFFSDEYTDKFKFQYAEYMRWMYEYGVGITIGSDSHNTYECDQAKVGKYLAGAGFCPSDFSRPKFRKY